jgi:hypothetical protein
LSTLEAEVLANVALDQGEPHYQNARTLRGVVVLGESDDREPVAFVSFTSGEVSNDHYAMYEVLLRRGPHAKLLSSSRTYGDVAGIEGLTASRAAVALTVFGFVLTAALLAMWSAVRALVSAASSRRARAL